MSNSNGKDFIKEVKIDLLNNFKKNAVKISSKIDKIQQVVIQDFDAVDSAFMQLKTFTKFQVNLTSNIIGQADFITRGVKYVQSVTSGTGTNKRYGDRNFLIEGRKQTLDLLTTETYTRTFKRGSPNKKSRKIKGRTF